MKYIHKQNGAVAVNVEFNEKFKTFLVVLEDGTTKNVSSSTFKRWWKKVDEEQEHVEENLVPMPGIEKLAELKDDNFAGDGTPLSVVGKEIAEQAKAKAQAVKSSKETEDVRPAVFEELKELVNSFDTVTKVKFCNVPYFMTIHKNGKAFAEVRVGKKGYTLNLKKETADDNGLSYVEYNNYYLPAGIKNIPLDNREILANLLN